MEQYLLLTPTSLHDKTFGSVDFETPTAIHSPNCGDMHQVAPHNNNLSCECELLRNRLNKRAHRVET